MTRRGREQEELDKAGDAGQAELRKLVGLAMQEMKRLTSIKGYVHDPEGVLGQPRGGRGRRTTSTSSISPLPG